MQQHDPEALAVGLLSVRPGPVDGITAGGTGPRFQPTCVPRTASRSPGSPRTGRPSPSWPSIRRHPPGRGPAGGRAGGQRVMCSAAATQTTPVARLITLTSKGWACTPGPPRLAIADNRSPVGGRPRRAAAAGAAGRPAPHRTARSPPAHLVIRSPSNSLAGTRRPGYVGGMVAFAEVLQAAGPDPDPRWAARPVRAVHRCLGLSSGGVPDQDGEDNAPPCVATCTSAGSWTAAPSQDVWRVPSPGAPARGCGRFTAPRCASTIRRWALGGRPGSIPSTVGFAGSSAGRTAMTSSSTGWMTSRPSAGPFRDIAPGSAPQVLPVDWGSLHGRPPDVAAGRGDADPPPLPVSIRPGDHLGPPSWGAGRRRSAGHGLA